MAPEIVHADSICTNQYSFSICFHRMFIPFTLNLSGDPHGGQVVFSLSRLYFPSLSPFFSHNKGMNVSVA